MDAKSSPSVVLLVEDDDDARESLARTLERAGYHVLSAASADAAIELAKRQAFIHVVVSDVCLGTETTGGLRVLRQLREQDIGAPVILITAFAVLSSVKSALNEGAAFLLEKPFRAREVVEVITRVLAPAPANIGYIVDRALAALNLTEKEANVARLLLKGLPSNEIARLEDNSDKTVRQHVTRIYAKCGVTSRAEFFHYVFPW
jgi:DNA-binding NarL/FixJ family response regulator